MPCASDVCVLVHRPSRVDIAGCDRVSGLILSMIYMIAKNRIYCQWVVETLMCVCAVIHAHYHIL